MLLVPNIFLTFECEQCVNLCSLRKTIQTCRNRRKFLLPQIFLQLLYLQIFPRRTTQQKYAVISQRNLCFKSEILQLCGCNKAYCMTCVRVLTALQCTIVLYSRSSQEVNTIPLNVGRKRQPFHMSYFAYACKTEGKNGISRLISEMA